MDFTGAVSRSCACPLSPVWRDLMSGTFALYATTHPVRLWVEDDFRYINHGPRVRYGCYCERHLEAFGERMGERVTRAELVSAMLRSGDPHPWREAWLDFLEDTLKDMVAMLRKAVQAQSPKTELGFMSSNPVAHELEGRRVGNEMESFAGDKSAAIRMSMSRRDEYGPKYIL